MEITSVQDKIQKKIQLLETARKGLRAAAEKKAESIANYERELMKKIVGLKMGEEFTVDGKIIREDSATNAEKVARGICWKERLEMEKAEASYKAGLTAIESIKAELNGWQSIFRHLEEA